MSSSKEEKKSFLSALGSTLGGAVGVSFNKKTSDQAHTDTESTDNVIGDGEVAQGSERRFQRPPVISTSVKRFLKPQGSEGADGSGDNSAISEVVIPKITSKPTSTATTPKKDELISDVEIQSLLADMRQRVDEASGQEDDAARSFQEIYVSIKDSIDDDAKAVKAALNLLKKRGITSSAIYQAFLVRQRKLGEIKQSDQAEFTEADSEAKTNHQKKTKALDENLQTLNQEIEDLKEKLREKQNELATVEIEHTQMSKKLAVVLDGNKKVSRSFIHVSELLEKEIQLMIDLIK